MREREEKWETKIVFDYNNILFLFYDVVNDTM
jgi:hypothetical protein